MEYINLVNKIIIEEKIKYALSVYNLENLNNIPKTNYNLQ